MDFSEKKVGKALQYADQIHATYAAVVGDHEIEQQAIELKQLDTGQLLPVSLSQLLSQLEKIHRRFGVDTKC